MENLHIDIIRLYSFKILAYDVNVGTWIRNFGQVA